MKVVITGANGFIGENLQLCLSKRKDIEVAIFNRQNEVHEIGSIIEEADFIYHLAGVNRPQNQKEFEENNIDLTRSLMDSVCKLAEKTGKKIPIVFSSSIQATENNPYGKSKLAAEDLLREQSSKHQIPIYIFRLPNVFGKWSEPNYNSVVATFCYNIARGKKIQIDEPHKLLTLVHVDDVIQEFLNILNGKAPSTDATALIFPPGQFTMTVGELAKQIQNFQDSRNTLTTDRVGEGKLRTLFGTFLSYMPPESFTYNLPQHSDERGVFTEVLKTPDCGQFSIFTSKPGAQRGGHYHDCKTEKFLIVEGTAKFTFKHMKSGEIHELVIDSKDSSIVESIPGWYHHIVNIGNTKLIVVLWASEVFDPQRPDTHHHEF